MYIQRVPHPLAHFNRDSSLKTIPTVFQTTSTNGTTSSGVSQSNSHHTGYVALAVVFTILFLGLVGFFVGRRRVRSLLPCTRRDDKQEFAPQMQREGHQHIDDGFKVIPSWNSRSASGSSRTPTSPSSEGPSTPINCEDRSDLGVHNALTAKDERPFVPIPIIVHTPTQTHQTTFLTGPDTPDSQEFAVPPTHHEQFFDDHLSNGAHGSVIRPHGLPLAPVPEESSSAMVSFPSRYFEVDEQTIYGMNPVEHQCR